MGKKIVPRLDFSFKRVAPFPDLALADEHVTMQGYLEKADGPTVLHFFDDG